MNSHSKTINNNDKNKHNNKINNDNKNTVKKINTFYEKNYFLNTNQCSTQVDPNKTIWIIIPFGKHFNTNFIRSI